MAERDASAFHVAKCPEHCPACPHLEPYRRTDRQANVDCEAHESSAAHRPPQYANDKGNKIRVETLGRLADYFAKRHGLLEDVYGDHDVYDHKYEHLHLQEEQLRDSLANKHA